MRLSCPNCGKPLESPIPLPVSAQCPYCMNVFAPTMSLAPVADGEAGSFALSAVRRPANALLILALFSLPIALLAVAMDVNSLWFARGQARFDLPPDFPIKVPKEWLNPTPGMLAAQLSWDVVRCVLSVVMIIGAIRMREMRSYGLAMTVSILNVVPCLTCCCFLGMPFGIWSIVVLSRPEIRERFT